MADHFYISFYLRTNTIYIFCGVLREIGQPKYIRFLLNADGTKIIVQPYDRKEFTSFRVPTDIYHSEYVGRRSFRIQSKALCMLLALRLGWDKSKSYRVPGTFFSNQKAMCFDLEKGKITGGNDSC